jgi:hypothetical protein
VLLRAVAICQNNNRKELQIFILVKDAPKATNTKMCGVVLESGIRKKLNL